MYSYVDALARISCELVVGRVFSVTGHASPSEIGGVGVILSCVPYEGGDAIQLSGGFCLDLEDMIPCEIAADSSVVLKQADYVDWAGVEVGLYLGGGIDDEWGICRRLCAHGLHAGSKYAVVSLDETSKIVHLAGVEGRYYAGLFDTGE